MMFTADHPYSFLSQIVKQDTDITHLTASYYFYRPQSLIDERHTYEFDRDFFICESEFNDFIENCPPNFEVAFHSNVKTKNGEIKHIPMIDMSTSANAQISKLKRFIDDKIFNDLAFYNSGRSFHVYGRTLMSQREWISFMGQLLLSNQKDIKPLVDPRWVGHRLIAGYSALRWTKNTSHYLSLPKSVYLYGAPISHQ